MQVIVRASPKQQVAPTQEERHRRVFQVANELVRMHLAAEDNASHPTDLKLPTVADGVQTRSFEFFSTAVEMIMREQGLVFGLGAPSQPQQADNNTDWASLHLLFNNQLHVQHSVFLQASKTRRVGAPSMRKRLSLIHSLIHLQLFMVTKGKYSPFVPARKSETGSSIALGCIDHVKHYHVAMVDLRQTPTAGGTTSGSSASMRTTVMQLRLIIGKYWLYISEALPSATDRVISFFRHDIRKVLGTSSNLVRFGSAAISRVCLQLIYRLRGRNCESNKDPNTPTQDVEVGKTIADLLLCVFCRIVLQVPAELLDTSLAPDAVKMMHAAQRSWAADFVAQICTSLRGLVDDVLLVHGGERDQSPLQQSTGKKSDFSLYAVTRGWMTPEAAIGADTAAMGRYKATVQAVRKEVFAQLGAISQVQISVIEAQKIGLRPHMVALTADRKTDKDEKHEPIGLKHFPNIEGTLSPYHVIVMGALGFESVKVAATLCHYCCGDSWAISDQQHNAAGDPLSSEQQQQRDQRLATPTAGVFMERFPIVDPSTTDLFNPPQLSDPSEEGQMLLSYLFSFLLLDERTVDVLTAPKQDDGAARGAGLEIVEVSSLYSTIFVHDLQSLQLSSMLNRPTLMLGAVAGDGNRTLQKLLALVRCEEAFTGHVGGAGDRETCLNLRLRFATRLAEAWKVVVETYASKGLRQYMVQYFTEALRVLLSVERMAADTCNPEQCLIQLETMSELFQLFPVLAFKEWPVSVEKKVRARFVAQFLTVVQGAASVAMEKISEHRDVLRRVMDQALAISTQIPNPQNQRSSLNTVLVPTDQRVDPTFTVSERIGNKLYPYLCGMQSTAVFKNVTEGDPLPPAGGLASQGTPPGVASTAATSSNASTASGGVGFSILVERWVPIALQALQVKGLIASGAAHDVLQLPIRESSPWLLHLMPTYLLATAPDPTIVVQEPDNASATSGRQLYFRNCKYGIPQRLVVQRFCTSVRAACQAAEAFHLPPAVEDESGAKKQVDPADVDGVGMALLAAESVYNNVRFWNGRVFSQVKVSGNETIKLIQERGKWYTAALINMLQCSDPRVLEQVCEYVEIVLAEVFSGMPKTEKYWRRFIGFTVQRSKNSATKASLAQWLLTLDERLAARKVKSRAGRSKL